MVLKKRKIESESESELDSGTETSSMNTTVPKNKKQKLEKLNKKKKPERIEECEGCDDSECEDCDPDYESESESDLKVTFNDDIEICEGCDNKYCEDCILRDAIDKKHFKELLNNVKIDKLEINFYSSDIMEQLDGCCDDIGIDSGTGPSPRTSSLMPPRALTPFERITAKDFIIKKELLPKGYITCLGDLIIILDHPDGVPKQKELCVALKQLDNLVGMKQLKEQIVNQILFFIQDLYEPGMFLHTVITGNPGCGKTSIAHVVSKIYKSLGFLSNDKVIIADRSDLVGMYLGHTAIKTKKLLESALGGIVLIDEAYSLGSDRGEDSFSKECIDTINQFLSEHADQLICIIAGYKDNIENCFFKQNSGLKRRFPWRFNIENYSPEELYKILLTQLGSWKLDISENKIVDTVRENIENFSSNGGDTQILLDRCKVSHARRIFFSDDHKTITLKDFDEGFKSFIEGKKQKVVVDFTNMMYM